MTADLPERRSPDEVTKGGDRRTEDGLSLLRWSRGPLPDPEIMAGYEQLHPGAAGMFLKLWEEEQHQRQAVQDRLVDSSIRSRSRGQWMTFVLSGTAIVGGLVLGFAGQPVAATFGFIGGTAAAAAGPVVRAIVGDRDQEGDR